MKLKKLFALALAGVMTLALLTGCSDSRRVLPLSNENETK